MLNTFDCANANEAWIKVVASLQDNNCARQMTRLGESRELIHASFQISDPKQRWISARAPAISPAFAIAEVFWILNGDNDSGFINYWNPRLPKYAGYGATYHGAYGYRIKQQFGIDQLNAAYHALVNNPETRQVVIQFWDPRTDLPNSEGMPVSEDIPCNICSMPKIRNNKLEWLQVMRSNDVFLGMPYNIIQFTTLQEIMAGWLGLELGGYYQISDSLHAYTSDLACYAVDVDSENTINPDTLALEKSDSDMVIEEMYSKLHLLISENLKTTNYYTLISSDGSNLPIGYTNLFLICCAYAARKRGWVDEMGEAISLCSNHLLSNIWGLWESK